MNWWVHNLWQAGEVMLLISWIFWVIFSITLHELAHGWAALWQGDTTPRDLGHLSASPLVHMGPTSLVVFLVVGIAWGAMPVNPSRFRSGRRGRVYVSAAGPAMNFALALLSLILLVGWLALGPAGTDAYRNAAIFLYAGGWLNLLLAAFNLLPVPPLDGSSILAGFSSRFHELMHHPHAPLIGMALIVFLFIFLNVGTVAVLYIQLGAIILVDAAGSLFGNPPLYDVLYG